MSRSIIGVSYQNDTGSFYALNRDESNSRGTANFPGTTLPLFLPAANPFVGTLAPQGFKERYANTFLQVDPKVRRRFPVGNPAALAVLAKPGSYIAAATDAAEAPKIWIVTSIRGERGGRNPNFLSDTGQDDGTPGGGVTGT